MLLFYPSPALAVDCPAVPVVAGQPGGGATKRGNGVRETAGLIAADRLLGEDNRHALFESTLGLWLHLASVTIDHSADAQNMLAVH